MKNKKIFFKKILAGLLCFIASFSLGWLIFDKTGIFDYIFKEKTVEIKQEIKKEKLKIGFITDSHCYAKKSKTTDMLELNWRCYKPLNFFVEKMNKEFKPDFVAEGGDFVEGKKYEDKKGNLIRTPKDDFIGAREILKKLEMPFYHVIGNHEMRSFNKATWREITGHDEDYYYFDLKGYRIIILDANHMKSGNDSRPGKDEGQGVVDRDQMRWLIDLLLGSSDYEKIVFIHHPPIDTDHRPNGKILDNGDQLRRLFNVFNIKAVFSGHVERLCKVQDSGVDYYVLQGFNKGNQALKRDYRYKDAGVFTEITVEEDGQTKVEMFYKEIGKEKGFDYVSLMVDDNVPSCQDGSTLLKEGEDDNKNKDSEEDDNKNE